MGKQDKFHDQFLYGMNRLETQTYQTQLSNNLLYSLLVLAPYWQQENLFVLGPRLSLSLQPSHKFVFILLHHTCSLLLRNHHAYTRSYLSVCKSLLSLVQPLVTSQMNPCSFLGNSINADYHFASYNLYASSFPKIIND